MKKFFVLAAAAAFALVACNKDNPIVDGSGNQGGNDTKVTGVVLNELSGADKFIELYNTTDKELSLEGVYLVKYDSSKDGGKSTTWTGAAGMKIAAKGYVVLESSDLADPAEDGDPAYAYESANHVFKGGLSGKKNVFIELYSAADEVLSEFKRGEEGAGWNQVSGFNNDKKHTFSRVPDGTGEWAYADPTKGAANGAKVADIEQAPEM
ncbi:MAG: lamin tail domain-containing protein [Bacteroidales bacterium]|nr:lamin tail domain-containing protein [Bacteroidales bacterium]